MAIKYHQFDTLAAATAKLAALRAAGGVAYLLTMNESFHEVRQIYDIDAAPSAIDAHIGSLADATLEPITSEPHGSDSRVILDARNVDQWGRAHGR